MKENFRLCVVVAVLAIAFPVFAAAGHHEESWTGWIADENCAKSYEKVASAGHVGCAKSCLKNGAKLALATESGTFLLDVDEAKAGKNIGHEVVIKGSLDKETMTIKVKSVSAL